MNIKENQEGISRLDISFFIHIFYENLSSSHTKKNRGKEGAWVRWQGAAATVYKPLTPL